MKNGNFENGDICIIHCPSPNHEDIRFENYKVKVVDDKLRNHSGIYGARVTIQILETKDIYRYPVGTIIYPPVSILHLIESPKPHEYSPVYMTGRYKTVGD